jgi:multiple antibiotic resistance protein
MDPFGNLVIINSLLRDQSQNKKQRIILRESFFAFCILLICAYFGSSVLSILGLSQPALRISGGIILFIVSLGMVFPQKSVYGDEKTDPFIVPIAMPLIAGPSTISIVFLLGAEPELFVYKVIAISCIIVGLVLYYSPIIFKVFGERGTQALERLTGMLLVMISVQMLLTGLKEFFS